jgi:hypothetical protein
MEPITLTTDLVNKILGYLGTRPYIEVAEMINQIMEQAQTKGKDDGNKV